MNCIQTILFILVLMEFILNIQGFRKQFVGAKGILKCNGVGLAGVRLRLYDVDRNPGDSDDMLAETFSQTDGSFLFSGSTHELTNIEPELRIYHDCNDDIRPCHRLRVFHIPYEWVYTTEEDETIFNLQNIELFPPIADEKRECLV